MKKPDRKFILNDSVYIEDASYREQTCGCPGVCGGGLGGMDYRGTLLGVMDMLIFLIVVMAPQMYTCQDLPVCVIYIHVHFIVVTICQLYLCKSSPTCSLAPLLCCIPPDPLTVKMWVGIGQQLWSTVQNAVLDMGTGVLGRPPAGGELEASVSEGYLSGCPESGNCKRVEELRVCGFVME